MAQVKTIGEAVRNMSVLMANMYYHLTKALSKTLVTRLKNLSSERSLSSVMNAARNIAKNVLESLGGR